MRKPKSSFSSLKKCSDAWTDPFACVGDQNCWRDNFECYDFDDDNEAGHGDGFGDPKTVNCLTADAPNLAVRCQSNARPFPRNLV